MQEDLGESIDERLAELYARDPSLDPRLTAAVDVTFEAKPLKEVLADLGKTANATLVSTFPEEQQVTLALGTARVGAVMVEIARQVEGRWTRTQQGYFLVPR